ncbi:hypothetical protein PVAND_015697 [Polypedilum vanderplanki]|uniref:Uncharacterized protein n=1 Tax=Polypedilum vanderplanki TaxID=319348 RepID=A0A9J6BDW1_POLVA|nr:hypothetical protein PVAND_015697 [Polypedilum vanderplanki]
MNLKFICAILVFFFCEVVIAQVPIPADGKCPTFENCTDKNFKFDAKLLIGYNYLISSVPYFFQVDQKCTWFNITQSTNTLLLVEKYETDVETHKVRNTDGIVDYKDGANVLFKYTDLELPMYFKAVLTHPDYAVFLACNDCGFFSKTGAGIYAYGVSKVPWPSCDIVKIINAKLNECGISNNYIKTENQDGCTQCKKP